MTDCTDCTCKTLLNGHEAGCSYAAAKQILHAMDKPWRLTAQQINIASLRPSGKAILAKGLEEVLSSKYGVGRESAIQTYNRIVKAAAAVSAPSAPGVFDPYVDAWLKQFGPSVTDWLKHVPKETLTKFATGWNGMTAEYIQAFENGRMPISEASPIYEAIRRTAMAKAAAARSWGFDLPAGHFVLTLTEVKEYKTKNGSEGILVKGTTEFAEHVGYKKETKEVSIFLAQSGQSGQPAPSVWSFIKACCLSLGSPPSSLMDSSRVCQGFISSDLSQLKGMRLKVHKIAMASSRNGTTYFDHRFAPEARCD